MKAGRAKLKKCELDQWVQVPQNEAALVPPHRPDIKFIATTGLAPCVGVLVVGSAGVGLAHIDSDSVGHAKKLAQCALGTSTSPRWFTLQA